MQISTGQDILGEKKGKGEDDPDVESTYANGTSLEVTITCWQRRNASGPAHPLCGPMIPFTLLLLRYFYFYPLAFLNTEF